MENVNTIVNMGAQLRDMFIEKDGVITKEERYCMLKLAEFCIELSKESGKRQKEA